MMIVKISLMRSSKRMWNSEAETHDDADKWRALPRSPADNK
jgi:hypothetical protein